jgi:hypothetical protein
MEIEKNVKHAMPLAHDQIIQRADSTSPAAGGSLDAMMYRI